jgi:hypothetical protein
MRLACQVKVMRAKYEHLMPCGLCLSRVGYGSKVVARLLGLYDKKPVVRWRQQAGLPARGNRKTGVMMDGRWASEILTDSKVRAAQSWAWNQDRAIELDWEKHPEAIKWEARQYYATNKGRINKRIMSDPKQKIRKRLRTRVYCVLKGLKKSAPTMAMLGCDIAFFKQWLESQFKRGMTWENYGSHWHVDHKIPCAAFDLTKPEEQQRCFHYTNLQPLEALKNWSKHARFNPTQTHLRIAA